MALLNQLAPAVSTAFGQPLMAKMRAVAIKQSQTASIDLNLSDPVGNPVDLTPYGSIVLKMRFRECVSGSPTADASAVTVVTTTTGEVSGTVPATICANPGIFWCEVGVYLSTLANVTTTKNASTANNHVKLSATNTTWTATEPDTYTLTVITAGVGGVAQLSVTSSLGDNQATVTTAVFSSPTTIGTKGLTVTFSLDGTQTVDSGVTADAFVLGQTWTVAVVPNLAFSNTLYCLVEPSSMSGATYTAYQYPLPSVQEVRMRLWDTDPAGNRLLNDYEFDIADICTALERMVHFWNTAQPPIDVFFNTLSFPFFMPHGYTALMLRVAAHRFRRNHLPYSGGGISIDDQNKFNEYQKVADEMWSDYADFVKTKRVQMNMDMGFGTLQSPYSYGQWTR